MVAYLSTQGIQLQSPDHNEAASLLTQALGASVVVFAADRRRHVDALDPSSFDRADLRRYYDELMGPAENGAADAMIGGIKLLHDALQRLGDDDVAAPVIG